ncbi:MAG: hypothetical protein RLN76_03615 [Phycisphaeraceae bacterium]
MKLRRFSPILILLLVASLPGCYKTREVSSTWDTYRDLAWADRRSDGRGGSNQQTWSIQAASFAGPDRFDRARVAMGLLRDEHRLDPVWMEDLMGRATIFAGRFDSRTSRSTRRTVDRVTDAEIEGVKVFAKARAVPVAGGRIPVTDPYNLAGYPGRYSLQIAAYDRAFGDNFRKAAEEAVKTLRQDDHEAYYFHGPHLSLVTIGIFEDMDFANTPEGFRGYGPRIRAIQEVFPYNSLNGLTIQERFQGQTLGNQPSSLIRVP